MFYTSSARWLTCHVAEFSEFSVYPGKISHMYKFPLTKIEKVPNYPLSIYIGTLGMPGTTAYQGLKFFASEKLKTVRLDVSMLVPSSG